MHFVMDSATNPSQCTGGPFARVVRSWISDDQTIPARLRKRHIDAPVRALTLDFDFSQIPERYGNIDLFELVLIIFTQQWQSVYHRVRHKLSNTKKSND